MDYVVFPFEKFVSCITTEYDVQADSILALYIEIAKYLRDNPIVSGLTVKEIIDRYLEENPPSAEVVSVNGKTGVVTGLYDAENPPPYPVRSVNGMTGDVVIQGGGGISGVTSVNGKTGVVTGLYDAENPPPYPVRSVNGKTGAVTGLYDAENPPPYPVRSVNGKTGDVTGLYDAENPPPYPVTSVNGLTGNVVIPGIIKTAYAPTNAENNQYSVTVPANSTLLIFNVLLPFTAASATLPAGSEDGITLAKTAGGIAARDTITSFRLGGFSSWYTGFISDSECTIVYKNIGSSSISVQYGVVLQLINPSSENFVVTVKGYY